MALHVGTMGWSYAFWKGKFYPENLSSKEFLSYYAKEFNTVEVNSTFYRIPSKQSLTDWKEQVPQGFLFSLKFPRVITHIRMLRDCQKEVEVFLERISLLQDKIGILLLQFPSTFGTKHATLLLDFLQNLPKTQRYAVEVRNQKLLNKNFFSVLRDNNVALAWVDSPFITELDEVTSNFIYIRWEGDRRQVKGTLARKETNKMAKIKAWTDRIKPLLEKQTEVFGYFSKYYSGYPPSDVRELLSMTHQKEAVL